jgi:hypothetical protein
MAKPREATEVGAAVQRLLAALARRAGEGELEALEQLKLLEDASSHYLVLGARAYREGHAFSWTEVGAVLGISRQAAHQRFGGDQ